MWKFFRKFIKKIKGPWPETSTGARMNPRTSLICGGLALCGHGPCCGPCDLQPV